MGSDVPELHECAGSDCVPGHHSRQLAGLRDREYLVPWFNGGCPWTSEFVQALNQSIPLVCFWAVDHFCLFSWPLPLPKQVGRATFL